MNSKNKKNGESALKHDKNELNAYAVTGQYSGEILLFWEPVSEAVCYAVEHRRGDEKNWEQIKLLSINHLKIDSLGENIKHYFRIAPITVNGPGKWSTEITVKSY